MSEGTCTLTAVSGLPGVSPWAPRLVDGSAPAPTASPLVRDLSELRGEGGPAWGDPAFLEELRADHQRLGASSSSLDAIDALAAGSACVVTGQQPGLLIGPLFSFYKILGAVALARAASALQRRRVVPVFWCGSDDADFDEVRRAWTWGPNEGPVRAELPRELWEAGQPVGAVHSSRIHEVEAAALARAEAPETVAAWLASMRNIDGLADRARAWVLRAFADEGVVVVDARSPRLRALGIPLFERYARAQDDVTRALEDHAESLAARGWPVPIDAVARRSGLFALENGLRRKLEPEELRAGRFDPESVSPSVLMRPVWQDALLAPIAAVLGPAELHYHGQLAPLYEALEVRAARPALRPHAVVVDDPEMAGDGEALCEVVAGSDAGLAALRRARLPRSWSDALDAIDLRTREAIEHAGAGIDDAAARDELDRLRARMRAAVDRARDGLADRAGHGPSPSTRMQWYNLRGRPQERAFAATQWWSWCGDDRGARSALEKAYLESIEAHVVPGWALALARDGVRSR